MERCFDIRRFGAAGDGMTINTAAIQQSIDTCTTNGGGTVLVSGGRYVTGTLHLKDNVTLHIDGGATLLGSTRIEDYATGTHKNMYDGEPHMDRCLLFARNAHHIGLVGQGEIDGQGHRSNFPNPGDEQRNRPMLLRFLNCTGITVRDIQLQHPAAWTSAWLYCDDIVVDGIRIHSRANWNGDGLDFDGCQRVRVNNCTFDTSDDSICLQTSRADRPCRDIVISNCIFVSKWAGMRIGLLSCGDFENVAVTNCIFRDIDDAGLKIQLCEGGDMRNMTFNNLIMRNVPRPIFMTFNRQKAGVETPDDVPAMRRMHHLHFSHIQVDNSNLDQHSSMIFTGLPGHPIENITVEDVSYIVAGGGTPAEGAPRTLAEYTPDNQDEPRWPEYSKLGKTIPSYGLYARHMDGLILRNIVLQTVAADGRPAVICDDVSHLELAGITVRGHAGTEIPFRLHNVQQAFIHGCQASGNDEAFVRVEGESSDSIHIAGDNLHTAQTIASAGDGAKAGAIHTACG